jgi:hydrophobic/amphiphilic exporter-1 (mainly G- bacteria), HAE1 family
MFISDFAIRRPIVTVVTMIALVVFGLAALTRLDTDEFPDIDAPIVFLGIAYPGAAPDVVEREVVTRIEDKISGISGVDKINSTSTDGFAQIIVQFVYSKPVDQATQDIRDAISAVRAQLPAEILEPIIQRFDPNQLPIVSLAITSSVLSPPQLTQLADQRLAGDLRAIGGVAQVNVVGGDSAQLNVNVRPTDLAAAGVGIDQVVSALRAQNLAAPVGNVNSPLEQRSIRLEGRFEHPEDFAGLVIAQRGGQLVTLGQVAEVEAGAAEPKSSALFNGRQAIGLDIVKSREYSTTAVAKGVTDRVKDLQKTLPPGTTIEVVRDAGTRVKNSVRNVEEALVEGAILTVLVVFLFLNSWRSTVITGLALPVSVLASFVPLLMFGFTLNTMSLLGLSLAIGILIDDATRSDSPLPRRHSRSLPSSCPLASCRASPANGSNRSRSPSRPRCSCRSSCRSRSTRCYRRTGPTHSSRHTSDATRSRARSSGSTNGSIGRRSDTKASLPGRSITGGS